MRLRVLYEKAGILLGFIPLIVYGILAGDSVSSVVTALGVATITTIIAGLPDLKKGMILMWATLALFGGAFVAVGVLNLTGIIPWMSIVIFAVLAAVTFGSMLVKTSFTLQYARGMVDRSLWQKPGFIRVNQLMTGVWGGVFGINLLLSYVSFVSPHSLGRITTPLTYLVLIAGIIFTIWYPGYVQRNVLQQQGKIAC
jgi:all-trans-retinol 13,14-reductase